MPFISKDWRSPGQEWVRYEGGWELKKTLSVGQMKTNEGCDDTSDLQASNSSLDSEQNEPSEEVNLNNIFNHHNLNLNEVVNNDQDERKRSYSGTVLLRLDRQTQPYCPITLKNTREIAGFNELAEAMLRLDMLNAVGDIRRFNYISKLMFLLFNHDKLSHLSGAAQKILFRMLEEMADIVYKTNQNQHILQKLIEELQTTMTIYRVWGSHLGSTILFKQHLESRRKITEFVERMQVEFKQDLASPGLVERLPEECIREILLRISDPKDLEQVSNVCVSMNEIAGEKRIWKELVKTHFNKQQIDFIVQKRPSLKENHDWKHLYQCLRRQFGLREEFTEMIYLCKKCCSLFWQSLGHPCFIAAEEFEKENPGKNWTLDLNSAVIQDKSNEWSIPLTPKSFLNFFSV